MEEVGDAGVGVGVGGGGYIDMSPDHYVWVNVFITVAGAWVTLIDSA